MADVLTEQDKRDILKAIEEAQALRAELARAKRAGLDVSDLERELSDLLLKLSSLKQVYITGSRVKS